ncbi:TolC family outer membrane protein [Novosphingobium colocasiae]|uniref:TolC family outer membrane protein n=1 Tax=Novosphingobium colocasiae TaxID=1256513 RepID=UPI0035AF57DE
MDRLAARAGLLACACLAVISAPVHADTLRDALAQAYADNPTLAAARAQLRGTDEDVAIAKAAGRPSASADNTYFENIESSQNSSTFSVKRGINLQPSLTVPIYQGGGVKNRIKVARSQVKAGEADLRSTESQIFSQVVAAYMDVIQNEALVRLNRNNADVLTTNLQATSDRFEIGDLTRTDVAQSQSRLALARGDVRSAEANLASARERYILLVGRPPGTLAPPPPLPGLPQTPQEAVDVALDNNPDLVAARERIEAADHAIDVAGAARLPTVSAGVTDTYSNSLGSASTTVPGFPVTQSSNDAQFTVRLSIPLYQGGRPAAQRRQAQALAGAAMEQEIAAERNVIAQVRSAWTAWQAATRLIDLNQTAVDAAALSLEGVRAENSVGNRTILDILDAEQEALRAQVQLVVARRNAYVAGFTLLAAMGRAEARDLNLDNVTLYDPKVNADRASGKWFDWENDPAPAAKATRTVDTPVQDGEIHD